MTVVAVAAASAAFAVEAAEQRCRPACGSLKAICEMLCHFCCGYGRCRWRKGGGGAASSEGSLGTAVRDDWSELSLGAKAHLRI